MRDLRVRIQLDGCPQCKLQNEETGLRARGEREALWREIGEIVEDAWEESDRTSCS